MSAVQTHTHGVLDTNALILLPRLTDQKQLPHVPAITAITLAELSVGPHLATTETEREARQAHLQQAEADFEAIPFDDAAARAFGQVAADLRRSGLKTTARAYVALIAATAISRGMAVYTANPGDYTGISRLAVVAIAHPDTV